MTHTKPPSFACSRFVVIASIMWRSAHMTVVALEVAVHTHRNATPHQSVQLLAKGAPNPIRECIFLVRLSCAPLCAIEEANAFIGSNLSGRLRFAAQIQGGNARGPVFEHSW